MRQDVFVLEQDTHMKNILVSLLLDAGMRVQTTNNASDALTRLRAAPGPHFVILGNMLPEMLPGMRTDVFLDKVSADPILATRHHYALLTTVPESLPEPVRPYVHRLGISLVKKPFSTSTIVGLIHRWSASSASLSA